MYLATIQCLNYRGQESKTPISLQFSDIPVTLKQSQGHQTYNEHVDPKHGYNQAEFERICCTGVWEKANVKSFSKEKVCQLSPLNNCESQK